MILKSIIRTYFIDYSFDVFFQKMLRTFRVPSTEDKELIKDPDELSRGDFLSEIRTYQRTGELIGIYYDCTLTSINWNVAAFDFESSDNFTNNSVNIITEIEHTEFFR